jgi:hypothetical protein
MILVLLGVTLPLVLFVRELWPLLLIDTGLALLIVAMGYYNGALAIPAAIIGGVGVILSWQSLAGHWSSWFYAWPLVPALIGLGLIIAHILGTGDRRFRTVGVVWLFEGITATALFRMMWILFPVHFSWPFILIGLGAMFLLATAPTGIAANAIPGTLVGGLGLLLYWQNTVGDWQSWMYIWASVPFLVGLGLVLANALGMGGQKVRKIGTLIIDWSLAALIAFALGFTLWPLFSRYWPALLILAGATILILSFRKTATT